MRTSAQPDQNNENDDERGAMTRPLLISTVSTPVPPAEAFISFRRFAQDADFMSPLANMTSELEQISTTTLEQQQQQRDDDDRTDEEDVELASSSGLLRSSSNDIITDMATATATTDGATAAARASNSLVNAETHENNALHFVSDAASDELPTSSEDVLAETITTASTTGNGAAIAATRDITSVVSAEECEDDAHGNG